MRKPIVLYSYHVDEERFIQNSNLVLEREIVNIESRNERELIFAVSTTFTPKIRVAIASKPGQVYYNRDADEYRVWFYSPDRDAAISAVGNYILDHVSAEIRTHASFIERLQKERFNAVKLLESIP